MANDTETPLHRWKENTLLIDARGRLSSSSEANKALAQVWAILEEAIDHSTDSSPDIDPALSLYTFFEARCHRALRCGEMTEREVELALGMSHMWGAYVGDRVELQSLKYFFLEDCIEGGMQKFQASTGYY